MGFQPMRVQPKPPPVLRPVNLAHEISAVARHYTGWKPVTPQRHSSQVLRKVPYTLSIYCTSLYTNNLQLALNSPIKLGYFMNTLPLFASKSSEDKE